jgi:hypothetical protein
MWHGRQAAHAPPGTACHDTVFSPMRPRPITLVLLVAASLVPSAVVSTLAPPVVAQAEDLSQPGISQITHESGNPIDDQGSSYDYRSYITSVTPKVSGLSLEVLEFADRLVLRNHTGKTVTVYGYEGEPYARVLPDGTVEVNMSSRAYYLNQNFYADVTVPASASSHATPHWAVADRTGQFEWHDHRIHWMSPIPPANVKNTSRRALIFDWQVPIQIGTRKGDIDGQLFWTPESSKAPTAVIVLGVAIALLGLLFVLFVRRRRSRAAAIAGGGVTGGSDGPGGPGGPSREAW